MALFMVEFEQGLVFGAALAVGSFDAIEASRVANTDNGAPHDADNHDEDVAAENADHEVAQLEVVLDADDVEGSKDAARKQSQHLVDDVLAPLSEVPERSDQVRQDAREQGRRRDLRHLVDEDI